MENNIFNSLSTEIFVSPCVYKLIIYLVILRQPFTKTFGSAWDLNPHPYVRLHEMWSVKPIKPPRTPNSTRHWLFIHEHTHPFRHQTLISNIISVVYFLKFLLYLNLGILFIGVKTY